MRDSTGKMKNGKAIELSCVVSEMVKASGEAGIDLISDLVHQIIVERVVEEWELALLLTAIIREKEIL